MDAQGSGMNKYRNVPTVVDGVRFASKAEARRDAELALLERAGEIRGLQRQPRYKLIVHGEKICTYVPDWSYIEKHGGAELPVCEDKKGKETPEFKLKFKLAKALFPRITWRLS